MVRRVAGLVGSSVVGLALVAACGSAPPPKSSDTPVVEEAPDPQSSEWLHATKGVSNADLQAECEHVRTAIKDEGKCNGEACSYASRLSEDWIRRCRKAVPAGFDEVSLLAREYNERKHGARLPCMREIEKILSAGCNDDPSCSDVAQEWTARCSDVAGSPLIVRILETRVEQAGKESSKVKFDKRGCKALSADILGAANCAQKFQCGDALAAADTYRKRCLGAGALPGLSEGLAELSVRVGAGQTPEPIAIMPQSPALEPGRFAVPLADGTGIVAMVCGDRATGLDSYLALRKDCADGEVVILQRQPGRAKGTLRIGRFSHPTDQVFGRNYPSLMVRGEVAARGKAGLARLAVELGGVAADLGGAERATGESNYDPEVGAALLQAFAKETFAVRAAQDQSALKQRDGELVRLFKSLARAKVDAAKVLIKPLEHAAFIRRSLKRPLADLDADGNVSVGALNAAAGLDLGAALPQSSAAYKTALAVFAERVQKKALTATQQSTVNEQLAQALAACGTAEGKVLESEGALVECGFGAACEAEFLAEVGGELVNARIDSTASQLRVLLANDSLDAPAATSGKAARCVEPWW